MAVPKLQVVRSLKPDVIRTLGEKYTSAFNALLRRELRMYTSILRKLVVSSASKLPAEPVLVRGGQKKVPATTTTPSPLSVAVR